jgi:hypothetical protein
VGVGESLTNWLLWRGGEFDKLVIVGVGEFEKTGYFVREGGVDNR